MRAKIVIMASYNPGRRLALGFGATLNAAQSWPLRLGSKEEHTQAAGKLHTSSQAAFMINLNRLRFTRPSLSRWTARLAQL